MPKELGRETLCCNYKRCPTVVVYDDGSAEITDVGDDGRVHRIAFEPAQRTRLAELLSIHVTPKSPTPLPPR